MNSLLIDELTKDTPSTGYLLSEAWEGLSDETKIEVLLRLTKEETSKRWWPAGGALVTIAEKALASSNPFIRYLMAKKWLLLKDSLQFSANQAFSKQWESLIKHIQNDPHPLVRQALDRDHSIGLVPYVKQEVIDHCFSSSPVKLLMDIREQKELIGGCITKTLHALVQQNIDDHILCEIVGEVITNIETHYVSHKTFFKEGTLSLLFEFLRSLPEQYASTAYLLAKKLPAYISVPLEWSNEKFIASHVTDLFSQRLCWLLEREDMEAGNFRAAILCSPSSLSEKLREAAAIAHVAIKESQLPLVIEQIAQSDSLASYCYGLPPHSILAIYAYFEEKGDHAKAAMLPCCEESTFWDPIGTENEDMAHKLRVYWVAEDLVKNTIEPNVIKAIPHLNDHLVPENVWETFIKLLASFSEKEKEELKKIYLARMGIS